MGLQAGATNESVLLPDDTFRFVGVCVREALYLTSLAAEEPVEVGADFVAFIGFEVVTLGATGLGKESVRWEKYRKKGSW